MILFGSHMHDVFLCGFFATFKYGVPGQVYLIVSIPDPFFLLNFHVWVKTLGLRCFVS